MECIVGIIGFVVVIAIFFGVAQYLDNKKIEKDIEHQRDLWQRNIGPDVVPGPLHISQEAYDKASTAVREDQPIARIKRDGAAGLADSMGFTKAFADFQPADVLTRWLLAYNFQAEMDKYPRSLFIPSNELKPGLADEAQFEEEKNQLIETMSFTGDESSGELQSLIARHFLRDALYLGPFRTELEQTLSKTGNHLYVCQFVIQLYGFSKQIQIATERLVETGQIKT
jgi:hypothetical protein